MSTRTLVYGLQEMVTGVKAAYGEVKMPGEGKLWTTKGYLAQEV